MNNRLCLKKIMYLFVFELFLFVISVPFASALTSKELDQIMTEEGNAKRYDYVDGVGVVTYAEDKHYATLIRETGPGSVLDRYLDEKGQPSRQTNGSYAVLKEYNDKKQNVRTIYLDAQLRPVSISSGYSTIVRSYNKNNKVEYVRYYDPDWNRVKATSGVYGQYNEYEEGRNTLVIYLDQEDMPILNKSGYAMLRRTFYSNGKTENEFYLDESGNPVSLSLGQYGLHREYDEAGKTVLLMYLDADGRPERTRRGYAGIRRIFYADGSIEKEWYLDENSRPVALLHGQYGVLHKDGKTYYLDLDGKILFNLNQFLHNNPQSVILLALLATCVSVFCGRRMNILLLAAYLLFIAYMTLLYRYEGDSRAKLELFWSYRQFFNSRSMRLEIMDNIWLFIPLGAIVYKLWPHRSVIPAFFALSIMIETIQYLTGLGLAELDDIISNTIGGMIGIGLARAGDSTLNAISSLNLGLS